MVPLLLLVVVVPSASATLRLKFHPDFSPPDRALAAANEARYLAYNKPVLSPTARAVKVLIQDSNGDTVTTVRCEVCTKWQAIAWWIFFCACP